MPPVWQIRLKNPAGAVVAIINHWTSLRLTPTVNAPGGYELTMADLGAAPGLFALDGQVEFWRQHVEAGIDWRLEFEAFHRDVRRWVDSDGVRRFASRGLGYADLLARRTIAAAAGSAEGEKSGLAEKVIKEYVNEQAGPGAGAPRALTGLAIEAGVAGGNAIALARSYRNLLEVCREITEIGGGDFTIAGTGPATFEFRWHEGQLGTDRRATVRFALVFGNMGEPEYQLVRSSEANAVLVGGQGEGAARTTVWRTDAGLIADSTWNRHEEFADARDATIAAQLNARGDTRLRERRPVEGLAFKVIQTPGMAYGRDYFLGDLVRGEFAGITVDQKIEGLAFQVDAQQEQLGVMLRDL